MELHVVTNVEAGLMGIFSTKQKAEEFVNSKVEGGHDEECFIIHYPMSLDQF